MNDKKNWPIIMSDAVVANDKIWFSNDLYNGLFCMDISSLKPRLVSFFPEESFETKYIHRFVEVYNNLIIFAPWNGNYLHIYNIDTETFQSIYIEKKHAESITGMLVLEENIYLVPVYPEQKFKKVSLNDFSVTDVDVGRFSNADVISGGGARTNAVAKGEKIFFSSMHTNKVFSMDFEKQKIDVISTDAKNIRQIYCFNEEIWGTEYENSRIWKYVDGKTEFYETIEKKNACSKQEMECWVSCLVSYDDEIVALPGYARDVSMLKNNMFATIMNLDEAGIVPQKSNMPSFLNGIVVRDKLILLPYGGRVIIEVSKDMKVTRCELFLCEDNLDIDKLKEYYSHHFSVAEEGDFLTLDEWISIL